ncbi:hypothetical protein [Luteimonas sp. e5]
MKRTCGFIVSVALIALPSAVTAQQSGPPCMGVSTPTGCYTELKDSSGRLFRDNDPFLFCTQGMRERPRAWNPLKPSLGLWIVTPGYCIVPSTSCPYPYSISWSQREVDGERLYRTVCPAAMREGAWEGEGQPDRTPWVH